MMFLFPSQQRHEQVLTTQLAQEQLEVELRNEDALIKEKETARLKKKQKESILEELVSVVGGWWLCYHNTASLSWLAGVCEMSWLPQLKCTLTSQLPIKMYIDLPATMIL